MILFEYINRVVAWHQSRDRGASAVEYILIVGLIAVSLIAGVTIFGDRIEALFQNRCTTITGAAC